MDGQLRHDSQRNPSTSIESTDRFVPNEEARAAETWMSFLISESESSTHGREGSQGGRRIPSNSQAQERKRISYPTMERVLPERPGPRRSTVTSQPVARALQGVPRHNSDSSTGDHAISTSAADQGPRPSRLNPRRSSNPTSRQMRRRPIILPEWQADADVADCPICGTRFSFWFRKHHCRKCGRVVCALCSPHRITIPRQFIVHPPTPAGADLVDPHASDSTVDEGEADASAPGSTDDEDNNEAEDTALDGGEEVRICNPCVPDPNWGPPPQSRHLVFRSGGPYASQRSAPGYPGSRDAMVPRFEGDAFRAHRRSAQEEYMGLGRDLGVHGGHPWDQPSRVIAGVREDVYGSSSAPSIHYLDDTSPRASRHGHRHTPSAGSTHRQHQGPGHGDYRSFLDLEDPPSPSTSSTQPRPVLREEDFCPVCQEILARGDPDDENIAHAREQHVQLCIETHFSSSQPRSRPLSSSSPPLPSPPSGGEIGTATATPNAQSRHMPSSPPRAPATDRPLPPTPRSHRTRPQSRMVIYTATEKDCLTIFETQSTLNAEEGGDGGEGGAERSEAAECVICFEEFEPGVEMARLECLCKFHRVCIRRWWETKATLAAASNLAGAGEEAIVGSVWACPVHQDNLS